MMTDKKQATFFAIMAAALYAVNIPLSKLLLGRVGPKMMASLLYLGAGLGMLILALINRNWGAPGPREPLTRKDMPYVFSMVALDIIAPILLMTGITRTASANVSLLNNVEIAATSLIALVVFKEYISRRLWLAIGLVTLAGAILSFEGQGSFSLSAGSLLVLGACLCWGLENNCTRMLSHKSSEEIVIIKGSFSGLGSLIIALALGERLPTAWLTAAVLLLGFLSYGMSINLYIRAQKDLGAAKTSAYYAVAPFLGVGFSLLLIGERPGAQFYLALMVMVLGTLLIIKDTVSLQHTHPHRHSHAHAHRHGNLSHSHPHSHWHKHLHTHGADSDAHSHSHRDLPGHEHAHP